MRYRGLRTLLMIGLFAFSFVTFASSQGNAATPRRSEKLKKTSPRKPSMKHRRYRWDSDLKAHPSRGSYRRRFQVRATAYQPIDTPMEGGRWTKTERDGRAVHGVAVDPRVIPLGTRLWIPGYGHAIADDIGTAIKGKRIDLRMQSSSNMNRWGARKVPVYILK